MRRPLLLLPIAALLLAGCVQNIDATRVGVPVTLASAAGQAPPPTGEPFSVTGKAVYAFWGITAISGPELVHSLAGQLVGGKALVDVRIKVRSRWSDVLVTVLTAGIIVPRTVTASGIVVK
ncbi:MAG TPA: hypothetical protein PK948_08440 [Gemmatimonadales bacterium]|nr:hypothetical protein [Gemmatimonadales bacterium]